MKIIVIDSSIEERFNSKYVPEPNSGCWLWLGATDSRGYGQIRFNNKTSQAHRVSYMLYNNCILDELCVLHTCDNPICVNPEHLKLGTQQDNLQDMYNKRRNVKGEKSNFSKLKKHDILEIRNKYSSGHYTQRDLAKEYNITQPGIWAIVNNINWRCP